MNLSEVKKLNEHNKQFVARLNEFLGEKWKLRYENKKVNSLGFSYRTLSIMVEKIGYQPIRVPLLATEGEDLFTEKFLKDRFDLICKNAKGKVLQEFKQHYDKFLSPKIMHDELYQLLSTTEKLKEIMDEKPQSLTTQTPNPVRTIKKI